MIERVAWPYAFFEELDYCPTEVWFKAPGADHETLEFRETSKGWVIAGRKLADYPTAEIFISMESNSNYLDVTKTVFKQSKDVSVRFGYQLLCQDTKYRFFKEEKTPGKTDIKIDLKMVGGEVRITPCFVAARSSWTQDCVQIREGSLVGQAGKSTWLTIDSDWSSDYIKLRWMDFGQHHLPGSALMHVQLVGDTPEVWLNDRFREHLGILDATGAKVGGVVGSALRELIWVQAWEKILIWAIDHEDVEKWEIPATRIVYKWRTEFEKNGFELPENSALDADELNTLSLNIQHCLETGRKLSKVKFVFQLAGIKE